MTTEYKIFHFQELGWTVRFPDGESTGKYNSRRVILKRGKTELSADVKLGEVLDDPALEEHYPHTVGYYRESAGEEAVSEPRYLELRRVTCVEEFWSFLNSLNI
ncbi:MAG: hypothetical protein ACE14S_09120 [Candidatus Bathyarchaeia archaeon]